MAKIEVKGGFMKLFLTLLVLISTSVFADACKQEMPLNMRMREMYKLMDEAYSLIDKPEQQKLLLEKLDGVKNHLVAAYSMVPSKFADLSPEDLTPHRIEYQNYLGQALGLVTHIQLTSMAPALPDMRREKLGISIMKLNQVVGEAHSKMRSR